MICINISFQNMKLWKDSIKRSEHLFDRMRLRGIGIQQIRDTISCGAKQCRNDGTIIAVYKWYKVVYREFIIDNNKKIYPITVMEV